METQANRPRPSCSSSCWVEFMLLGISVVHFAVSHSHSRHRIIAHESNGTYTTPKIPIRSADDGNARAADTVWFSLYTVCSPEASQTRTIRLCLASIAVDRSTLNFLPALRRHNQTLFTLIYFLLRAAADGQRRHSLATNEFACGKESPFSLDSLSLSLARGALALHSSVDDATTIAGNAIVLM